jgi:hypothetical protein
MLKNVLITEPGGIGKDIALHFAKMDGMLLLL